MTHDQISRLAKKINFLPNGEDTRSEEETHNEIEKIIGRELNTREINEIFNHSDFGGNGEKT